ncbi:MAG: glutaredoxin, partial [Rhodobacteraceae bacterium]|nr:glutaredoxin [Paracoccaceae bacterium]
MTLFALEWCEFSWSLRRFLRDLGVRFRSVDLDSVEMQRSGLGGDIRVDLHRRIGQPTIPQVFVGGRHVGGATDLLALHDAGELVPMLEAAGSVVTGDPGVIGRSYLPGWL